MGQKNDFQSSRQPSRLLALPTELQVAIYEYILIYPGALVVDRMLQDSNLGHDLLWDYLRPVHLAITQSCYFLRGFTSGMFYSRNTFHVNLSTLDVVHLRRVELWYLDMGHERRLCIRSMRLFGHEGLCRCWWDFQDAMRSIEARDPGAAHFAIERGNWEKRRGCDDLACYKTPCGPEISHMASALEKSFLTEEDSDGARAAA